MSFGYWWLIGSMMSIPTFRMAMKKKLDEDDLVLDV